MWWKRYEPLLEAKPTPVREVLVDLIAKELCEMCEHFPPPEHLVAWEDAHLQRRLAGRLHDLPKMAPDMVDLVGRLIALDLNHDADAIDHIFRNAGYAEACPTALHLDAVRLCWRTGLEALYETKDQLPHLLKRADLVRIAERFPHIFRRQQRNNANAEGAADDIAV